jgi:hypothetical protein
MNRLSRAWAVLLGLPDPQAITIDVVTGRPLTADEQRRGRVVTGDEAISAAQKRADDLRSLRAENASLRASLDDAHRQHAITSAKAAGLERVLRTILERADQGLANPTENGR